MVGSFFNCLGICENILSKTFTHSEKEQAKGQEFTSKLTHTSTHPNDTHIVSHLQVYLSSPHNIDIIDE